MKSQPTVSVVIPAYNEAKYLGDCLRALEHQTVKPHEIIVVDNNSDDATAAVAASFPQVKLLTETRQGIVFARSRGFDAATGDIIARLDADALPTADWLAKIKTSLTKQCDAVTGPIEDLPLRRIGRWTRDLLAHRLNRRLSGFTMLLGANMAIKREAWRSVRSETCTVTSIHEDLDLAVHLHKAGFQTCYDPGLLMHTASRRYSEPTRGFYRYLMLWPQTFRHHQLPGIRRLTVLMYILLAGQFVSQPYFRLRERAIRRQRLQD